VAIASVATVLAVASRRSGLRVAAAATALVALTGWLLVHVRVLTEPVVVSTFEATPVRLAVAIAIGLTAAGLVLAALVGRQALDEYASRPPAQRGRRARARRPAAVPRPPTA
jgi:hypothetical protein